jgi:hypothetical protein
MKVYEGSYMLKHNFKRIPEIKIKNKRLEEAGFKIGANFEVIYTKNKILLKLKEGGQND